MRLALLLLASGAVSGAPAFAQNGSGFQQTQGPSSYGGSGNDFGNSWRSDQAQTGSAPAAREPMPQAQGTPGGEADGPGRKPAKRARKIGGPRNSGEGRSGESGDKAGPAADDAPPRAAADVAPPVDLDTARENFAALVESYVAGRSRKGYWSFAVRKGAKARRLVKPAVDEDSVRKVRGARYAARVSLRDQASRKPVALEFEADFTGSEWKIVAVRPATVNIRR